MSTLADDDPHAPRGQGRGPQEFDDLFRVWYPRLVTRAFLVSGGRLQLAQDAAQETFVRCWRRMNDPTGAAVDNWPGWLKVTAVRETLAVLATETRTQGLDAEALDWADGSDDLADRMDLKAAYRTACSHIARLSARQREVVARNALAGESMRDIAMHMGITEGTARAHLHRARQALEPVWREMKAMGVLDDTDEGGQR